MMMGNHVMAGTFTMQRPCMARLFMHGKICGFTTVLRQALASASRMYNQISIKVIMQGGETLAHI